MLQVVICKQFDLDNENGNLDFLEIIYCRFKRVNNSTKASNHLRQDENQRLESIILNQAKYFENHAIIYFCNYP